MKGITADCKDRRIWTQFCRGRFQEAVDYARDNRQRLWFIDLEAGTLDYRETLEHLLRIYNDYNYLERIFVAPIGSKMQAVAVGIFRAFMKDIQIVYPTPRKFTSPTRYTEGIRKIYRLNLDVFDNL
ncbi:MAG: hypothetical protein L0Y73_02980 [Candidatus Aminicenantes bacterium]|nr:hypothetical protein [Candidatus Aminicenantes bacterium]